eukprot:TRINITY_DN72959_c0_g1_i1.p2 TRINITY_DN72959_c0_g1~~TRINITY_DN72959_c0_g1_i1.p2  ORF type:complete len:596 (-),score=127.38 TRINITY_DN72959_c0_g1_i1:35-1822(-)
MRELSCAHCGFTCTVSEEDSAFSGLFPRCSPGKKVPRAGADKAVCADPGPLTVLLYYSYVTIGDVEAALRWHRRLCEHLDLKGRVRASPEGLNVTLDGGEHRLRCYCAAVRASGMYGTELDFKLSSAGEARQRFPRLTCKPSLHVVEMGVPDEAAWPEHGGKHLSPEEWHEMLTESGTADDVVLLDTRNVYESRVGQFRCQGVETIAPDLRHFAQFPGFVDSNLEQLAGKRVMMYCTGGVRCERASSYLAAKGVAKEVLQLKGGISRYLERYEGQPGFYAGKNFVFDYRRYEPWHDGTIVGRCDACGEAWDDYDNGREVRCRDCRVLLLLCDGCRRERQNGAAAGQVVELLCAGDRCVGEQIRCGCGCSASYSEGPICRRTGFHTRASRSAMPAPAAIGVASSGSRSPANCLGALAAALCGAGAGGGTGSRATASRVRAATAAEAERCLAVINDAYVAQYGAGRYKTGDAVAAAIAAGRMLVACDASGAIAGCAAFEVAPLADAAAAAADAERGGSALRFGPLAVDPARQCAGHGGELLSELECRARAAGHAALEAEVRRGGAQGPRLMEFYRRRGYSTCGPRNRNYALLRKSLA